MPVLAFLVNYYNRRVRFHGQSTWLSSGEMFSIPLTVVKCNIHFSCTVYLLLLVSHCVPAAYGLYGLEICVSFSLVPYQANLTLNMTGNYNVVLEEVGANSKNAYMVILWAALTQVLVTVCSYLRKKGLKFMFWKGESFQSRHLYSFKWLLSIGAGISTCHNFANKNKNAYVAFMLFLGSSGISKTLVLPMIFS